MCALYCKFCEVGFQYFGLILLFWFSITQRATQAAGGIFQHLEKFNISMANAKGSTASAAAPDAPFERLGLLL